MWLLIVLISALVWHIVDVYTFHRKNKMFLPVVSELEEKQVKYIIKRIDEIYKIDKLYNGPNYDIRLIRSKLLLDEELTKDEIEKLNRYLDKYSKTFITIGNLLFQIRVK